MDVSSSPTRCASCDRTLAFAEWSHGQSRCSTCLRSPRQPAVPVARGSQAPRGGRAEPSIVRRPNRANTPRPAQPARADHRAHERMLDEIPEELIAELVAALEAEVAIRGEPKAIESPVRGVLEEIGFGRTPGELQWAAWGFAGGFAGNVALAKYAQMSSGAPMSEFFGPIVIGGVAAGGACAGIMWGLAKLRRPA